MARNVHIRNLSTAERRGELHVKRAKRMSPSLDQSMASVGRSTAQLPQRRIFDALYGYSRPITFNI